MEKLLINRELSWLSFNDRVLQEAQDENNPIIERLRFLGIYSNNMDEFFRVRVANIKRMSSFKKIKIEGFEGSSEELMEEIRKKVIQLQKKFELTYNNLIKALKEKNIYQLNETNLNPSQIAELNLFFHSELKHVIVPIILENSVQFPKLRDKSIYLAVKMHLKRKVKYALIEIPSKYSRFYQMKKGKNHYFILLDDIIRLHLNQIFNIFHFEKIEAYTFKFTRDAELNLDDDLSTSFIEKIEKSLKNRKKGVPVRFVYDQTMPEDLQLFLLKSLNLKNLQNAIPGGRYHNFKDFSSFPNFGYKEFNYPPLIQAKHPLFLNKKSLIKCVLKDDVLIHFPYQTFDYVVDLLREAAIDPYVKKIQINIYRVTADSQILNALMNAVSNGKEVVVFFELQARFDEENNLIWAERLNEHGAKVIYGYKNYKVHSKLFLIERINKGKIELIAYVGTGNFHEKTAKIYTDLALITSNKEITTEVKKVFHILDNTLNLEFFKHLLVSPFNQRKKLIKLIQREIDFVKKGGTGLIQLKINNLVDKEIIEKLYAASNAGVKIQMIIRGVCCLVPGIKNQSENIEIISIVGRFLEHSRFLIFYNNGNPQYFITSADIMERNLDKRIEVGVPILDSNLKNIIQFIFDTKWKDTLKARIIDENQENKMAINFSNQILDSQSEMLNYYHKLEKTNIYSKQQKL
ncbi:MAG: polyphosphate kinase 1 [Flavobacteriia bacterium]|nr:polyphosphate kinase 1 [Flavobacteriia bacterium]